MRGETIGALRRRQPCAATACAWRSTRRHFRPTIAGDGGQRAHGPCPGFIGADDVFMREGVMVNKPPDIYRDQREKRRRAYTLSPLVREEYPRVERVIM